MSISRIGLGILSTLTATAVFAISQNARAQQCGCYTGGGAGCPATFAATSYGSPTVESCNLPYYWSSGAGAATLLQDESSSTSGAYAAEATSKNNVAILAYTGGGPAAIIAQSQTTTVPTKTSAISAIAASGYGGYFTSPGTGTAGTNAALYGNATGTGSTGTGVLGTGSGFGVFGSTGNGYPSAGVYGTSSALTKGQGVWGSVTGSESVGVIGETDVGYGTYGIASGTSGIGATGYAAGVGGYGVEGFCGGSCDQLNGYAGYFSGNVNVTSGSYYYNGIGGTCVAGACTVSDRRLKKNIEPLAGAIDKLLQLKGVTYEWNALDEPFKKQGVHTGVIAQDVEKVFPEWVMEDSKGIKAVNPDPRSMLGLTVEAFRAQQTEIEDLKARLKAVEDTRRPVVSMNANGLGMGLGGLAIAGALFMSRRKRSESEVQG